MMTTRRYCTADRAQIDRRDQTDTGTDGRTDVMLVAES